MTATHDVLNQPDPLVGLDLYAADRALRDAVAFNAGAEAAAEPALHALGALAGSAGMQAHARLANAHPPVLHSHDRVGRRIDEVEFHPSYHALMGAAAVHGLHAAPWAAQRVAGDASAHVRRAAGFVVFTAAEPSVLCPVSMTYAAAPALAGNPAVADAWLPRLTRRAYDPRFIPIAGKTAAAMGMGMTEKQGGSDVRANTTRAEADGRDGWGERYVLTGHKWFFSAPMCDAFLVLAQADSGLTCFFLPRWRPDGTLNAIRIQRLKDKLGNKANASSEVEFERAHAWRVGEEGRGIAQILEMGALTRLDCALGSAGQMRQALALALHHAAQRRAFGRALVDQPLMLNVLADLALESEAATALALRLARTVDRPADARERAMRRLLTPVAKFWVCKRASAFAQEAMECLGGNGYVEDAGAGVMARLYREAPLNSIWEGAGNVMALDLLRALRPARRSGGEPTPAEALDVALALSRGRSMAFDRHAGALLARLADPHASHAEGEHGARRLARDAALAVQAALLAQHAPEPVFDAFCRSRLEGGAGASAAFGLLPAGIDCRALVERARPLPAPAPAT